MITNEYVEKILTENNIKFFKGKNETQNIFNIPYRGIKDEHNHIDIYIEVLKELNIIKFMIIEKANNKMDINLLKSSLLHFNSTLNFGTLSMRSDSDTIEYKVDCQTSDEEFSIDQYIPHIFYCINVYEELKEKEFIL